EAVDNMLEPSDEFNKGYQKPNSTTWNKVLTNSESEKSLVLIIDPSSLQPDK
ncbi:4159_t:CDS:1, partial [Entrophospora sp. SA101]